MFIYWHKNRKKWSVILRLSNRQKHIGFALHRADASVLRNQALFSEYGVGGLAIAWYLSPRAHKSSSVGLRHRITLPDYDIPVEIGIKPVEKKQELDLSSILNNLSIPSVEKKEEI